MENREKLAVSVGVFVHNEEKNIDMVLKSLTKQVTNITEIEEIIVVSSGSFDKTNQIVREWEKRESLISLHVEAQRKGKTAAINLFLQMAKAPVVVTVSGDLRLKKDALEEVVLPLLDAEVGMVGAHPKPSNAAQSSVGQEIALLWELHHRVSLIKPKCGEMVAFRNVIRELPKQSAVDEATIEVLLQIIGYAIVYAPRAIVYNKGPLTVREFILQRRRVFTGHQWVAQNYHYEVVTMQSGILLSVIVDYLLSHPEKVKVVVRLLGLEFLARLLGWVDFHILNKNPYVWKMISR